jgi:hypothetical protein
MQQHSQLPRYRDHRALLSVLPSAFADALPKAPQIAILPEWSQNVLRTVHQRFPQIVQRWIVAALRKRKFFSLAEVNQAIAELLVRLNQRPFRKREDILCERAAQAAPPLDRQAGSLRVLGAPG